ncbi:hypothetical protein CRE_11426 [Caenorhabditis remanei]|uniref:BTB domain-containing protein n=1 Tax=Caenorhabditis remanei TaxID=31234 RepID=E3NBF7_CAERE|nr:hypothetical protein CRE_11426 [Caenorhabditis remanei]
MNIGLFSSTRNAYFDLVHLHMNAKIILLDGEKYATIPMDEPKELIIYCDKKFLVVEVYSSGTRIEQTTGHSERRARRLLSYHSEYFNTLFNGEFKEKSMQEIPIKDVTYEDFATFLSLVQDKPIKLNDDRKNLENLLQLSDRFLMPAVKRHVEPFIALTNISKEEKMRLADKYDLEVLLEHALKLYKRREDYRGSFKHFENFSDKTKAAIFNNFFRCFDGNL